MEATMTDRRPTCPGPEVWGDTAVRLGFHRMTANEVGRTLKGMLAARPKVGFPEIEAGKTYEVNKGVLRVIKTTPSGKQAEVLNFGELRSYRAYAGSYAGATFTELDDDLIAMVGVTHRAIVEEAVDRGLDVPAEVRREQPDLFVDIPERFAKPRSHGIATTAAERVLDAISPPHFSRKIVGPETILARIEAAHIEQARLIDAMVAAVVDGSPRIEDFRRYEREFLELVEFYRWLLPHVSPGGALYIEAGEDGEDF
jgi:hypothetical protein